jgi:mRNA interferase MazF
MPTARFAQPRRGEVWLVNLDPAVGHEIQKTRPVVVVTNDVYNRHNWVVLVVPFTTRDVAAFDQVLVRPPEGGLSNPSVTLPDQLTAIDRSRMVKRMGKLSPSTLLQVDQSLKIVLDLR